MLPQAQHRPPVHSSQDANHTFGPTTRLFGSLQWSKVTKLLPSRPLRLGPFSPRSNPSTSSHGENTTGSSPSLQPLIEFPFSIQLMIPFVSWMFGSQSACWRRPQKAKTITPAPTPSLPTEASLQLPFRAAFVSGNILPVVIPCGGNSESHLGLRPYSAAPLFNFHQTHRQSWVVAVALSKCGA